MPLKQQSRTTIIRQTLSLPNRITCLIPLSFLIVRYDGHGQKIKNMVSLLSSKC